MKKLYIFSHPRRGARPLFASIQINGLTMLPTYITGASPIKASILFSSPGTMSAAPKNWVVLIWLYKSNFNALFYEITFNNYINAIELLKFIS